MDDHMGLWSTHYMSKIKGFDKQVPNLKSLERVSTYKFKPEMDIDVIKAKLAEARINKRQ